MSGDLLAWDHRNGSGHSQTLTRVGDSRFDLDDDKDFLTTIQGNEPAEKPVEKSFSFVYLKVMYWSDLIQPKKWNFHEFDKHATTKKEHDTQNKVDNATKRTKK